MTPLPLANRALCLITPKPNGTSGTDPAHNIEKTCYAIWKFKL